MMVCLTPLRFSQPCAQACSSSPLIEPLLLVSLLASARHCAQVSVPQLPLRVANETCVSVLAAMYSTCGPRWSLSSVERLRVMPRVLTASPQL